MKRANAVALLVMIAVLLLPGLDNGFGAPALEVPENNYPALKKQIRKTSKDTSAIRSWFEKNLELTADTNAMFTKECLEFVWDVNSYSWGFDESITKEQLYKKWGHRFDPGKYFEHAFENGNCGWGTRKLTGFRYLGELNGGDWFQLTIKGGCGENDYSQTLRRVVKVISTNGRYQIANMVGL